MKTYRHGDVLLVKVNSIPSDAARLTPGPRGYVLAEGEVTGHAHTLDATPGIEVYERDGTLYLRVGEVVPVKHEEHNRTQTGTVPELPQGLYKSIGQQTWNAGRSARVLD